MRSYTLHLTVISTPIDELLEGSEDWFEPPRVEISLQNVQLVLDHWLRRHVVSEVIHSQSNQTHFLLRQIRDQLWRARRL